MSYETRQALLNHSRRWIAEHYEAGDSEPVSWDNAIRAMFDLPTEGDVDIIRVGHFTPGTYRAARSLFRAIIEGKGSEDEDAQWCAGAWESITPAQPDLSDVQKKECLIAGMLDALQFYVTYHPGGLFEATRDLNVAASGGFEMLLGEP